MKIEKQRYFDIVTSVWEKNRVSTHFQEEILAVLRKIWITSNSDGTENNVVSLFELPIVCAESIGGTTRQVEHVAAAWSLLYSALYLLDKIEDQELEQLSFQQDAALLTNITTGIIATVELILDNLEVEGRSAQDIGMIRSAFHKCLITMCAGQSLDLQARPLTLAESWEVSAGKSGAFFALGCYSGALVSNGDTNTADSFYRFGQALGLLIQIEDDIDGLWGKPNKKSDIFQGKYSLPVAYAFSVIPPAQGAELQDLLRKAKIDYNAEEAARSFILKSGALLYLFLEAEKHKQTALACLEVNKLEAASRVKLESFIYHLDMQRYQGK